MSVPTMTFPARRSSQAYVPRSPTHACGATRSAPQILRVTRSRTYRGRPAADLDALRDLLVRLARLAHDLPEVADLDLTPVLASPRGAFPRQARVHMAPLTVASSSRWPGRDAR